ncbi:MAG: calcineurin-like phosphoesterase C-terminal domain-containing protein [Pirellulales bacterium]|nr:calcineurin-like phosphoesterase C-terminal domain-containing protein [Pirellulales bacterium]
MFHDKNGDQHFNAGDVPLGNIGVSNGQKIVSTGADGRFTLSIDADDDIVFVLKPRGWRTPLSKEKLPQFFYIHKPNGSPKSKYPGVDPTGPLPELIEFPLYPQQEPDQFRAILFGDPQPRDQKEVDYISRDVVSELIGTDASFGVTLGDIAYDNLSLFGPLTQSIALIGIPWYNVIGNHDLNRDAKRDELSDETFERVFGPNYYSFDYGPVHFLVLDDVVWEIPDGGKPGYEGGLGAEQMGFIREDLARIPEDQLLVVLMHIPLVDVEDRHELYRLIEMRPFCMSIAAHKHLHVHRFITAEDGWHGPQPHHHVINVTVSGSWWCGAPDERGIPHTMMADGAPNGYSIISFDGNSYQLQFRAAGRSAKYQMQIHAPDSLSQENLPFAAIYANVFNGSERTKVEYSLGDGTWLEMEKVLSTDPGYSQMVEREAAVKDKNWREITWPELSTHLWRASLPTSLEPGSYVIQVKATDMHGATHYGNHLIRVTP